MTKGIDKIFNYIIETDNPQHIDLFRDQTEDIKHPDYTGASADYYLDKFFNNEENMGNMEGIQNTLSAMGVVAPPADALNSIIYAAQGEYGMAGLSLAAIIPAVKEAGWIAKTLQKSGEPVRTLYRAVPKWRAGKMVENGVFVGGSGAQKSVWGMKPPGTLWTSDNLLDVLGYTGSKGRGPILRFDVPESFIKNFGEDLIHPETGKVASTIFENGIPKQFLTKVFVNKGHALETTMGGASSKQPYGKWIAQQVYKTRELTLEDLRKLYSN